MSSKDSSLAAPEAAQGLAAPIAEITPVVSSYERPDPIPPAGGEFAFDPCAATPAETAGRQEIPNELDKGRATEGLGERIAGRIHGVGPRDTSTTRAANGPNPERRPAEVSAAQEGRSGSPLRRGPKTAAAKARIALNALTHGISSTRLVVPRESCGEWERYRRTMVDALAPIGPVETALSERVASALWRLRRVTAYEEATIAERQHLEKASARLLPHPVDIDKLIRYEAHLTRQLFQPLHELESMRAARRGQPAPLLRVDVQGAADQLAAPGASTA